MFIGKASNQMLEAAIRLGKLSQSPEDAPVLGPLTVKERFYHLLKGPAAYPLTFSQSNNKGTQ